MSPLFHNVNGKQRISYLNSKQYGFVHKKFEVHLLQELKTLVLDV